MKKESASPLTYETSSGDNLFSILQKRAQQSPDGELIKYKDEVGKWQSFSAAEFLDLVKLIARGLISRGFKKGDAYGSYDAGVLKKMFYRAAAWLFRRVYAEKYLELSSRDKVYATNRVMDILDIYDYSREEYGCSLFCSYPFL